jgi:hypothetical protein
LSGLPKLMMAEAGNFPELSAFYQEEVIERGERMVASMLRRGMERKEIRLADLKIDARLLISPMIMMMMWKHLTGVCKVDRKSWTTIWRTISNSPYMDCVLIRAGRLFTQQM